jgi:hypothetical protein
VECSSPLLLDALDHLCHLVDGDPGFERVFYASTTAEEMVALAEGSGILIGADDFRALLRSGTTERWLLRGNASTNPIIHLQLIFGVR